jgi:hypothetical protein
MYRDAEDATGSLTASLRAQVGDPVVAVLDLIPSRLHQR